MWRQRGKIMDNDSRIPPWEQQANMIPSEGTIEEYCEMGIVMQSVLCTTMLYYVMLCHGVSCLPCYGMLCNAILCPMSCYAMLCQGVSCHAMPCYVMLCHAYQSIACYNMQWCIIWGDTLWLGIWYDMLLHAMLLFFIIITNTLYLTVVQYGFIIIFAAAFPIAPLMGLANNLVWFK